MRQIVKNLVICLFNYWGGFLLRFLSYHFPQSSFCGRVQVGCRGYLSSTLLPALTCSYSELLFYISSFYISPTADYYVSGNTFSGVSRRVSSLFSLHNLVVDVDCHDDTCCDPFSSSTLLSRLEHSFWNISIPMPTSVVFTGRGFQFWWNIEGISEKFKPFYEETIDFFCTSLDAFLEEGCLEDFSMFHVDHAASRNILGYFRLPGTWNTKSKTKVTYDIIGPSYKLMDLFHTIKEEKSQLPPKKVVPLTKRTSNHHDFLSIAEQRASALFSLRSLRDENMGAEERNNLSFIFYNSLVTCYGHEVAYGRMLTFNQGFKQPMTERELDSVISTAKKKGGYHYSTAKMVEFLHITAEEQAVLHLHHNHSTYLTKQEKTAVQNYTKKQERNKNIISLYEQGKNLTEISGILGISLPTISKVLKENKDTDQGYQKKKALELLQTNTNYKEIAEICHCSVRTIQRLAKQA